MKEQIQFNLSKGTRGGRRPHSGRKRKSSPGVSHRSREVITSKTPLHINLKSLHPLRNPNGLKSLKKAIENARKFIRVLHYSLESNHLHLLIEADDNEALAKGMRSLTNTLVKCIGRGQLQKERYHLHVLRTPAESRNAVRYVLGNHTHHTSKKVVAIDGYSSIYTLSLKEISSVLRITLAQKKIKSPIELDSPKTWLMKQALNFMSDKH